MFCQPGYQFFMYQLTRNPHNYLEIGVFNGDSIRGLAMAAPTKTIYAIDPFIEDGCTTYHSKVNENDFMPTQHENTMNNIRGLDNITLLEMTSVEFSEMLTDELVEDMDIGWVLIDGSHHYKDVINDIHLSIRLIGNKRGGIVFDDLGLDNVAKAHAEFLEIYKDKITQTMDLWKDHPGTIVAYGIN